MRGFIQIPIVIIILLITGGAIAAYSISQKPSISLPTTTKSKEATPSAKEVTPSFLPSKNSNNTSTIKAQQSPTPKPSTSSIPSPSNTPNPSQIKSSSATVILTSLDSSNPGASGQVSVELNRIDPYYTTGKIASFNVNGNVFRLKTNTPYSLGFSPPNDPGSAIGVLDFTTDGLGNASINVGGRGISYFPSNPSWSISIYPSSNASGTVLKGSFSISSDTISANNPSNSSPSSVKLDSISPNSGNFETEIVVRGSGFGVNAKNVWFYSPQGLNIGGGPILSWSDTEIKTKVPPSSSNTTLQVEVETTSGGRSNRLNFTVNGGQPQISSIPSSAHPGQEITIQGNDFGESNGTVNLYGPNSSANLAGNCNISSWSNNQIKCNIPASFSTTGEYGISVVTSDNRHTSYKYLFMCDPTGCG